MKVLTIGEVTSDPELFERLPVVHWKADRSSAITYLGGDALRLAGAGVAARVGLGVGTLADDGDSRDRIERAHRRALDGAETTFRSELGGRTFQAHVAPLRARDGAVCGVRGVALDLTEQVNLELQLRHAVKMEALGRLVGGIAHDFNNRLSAMLGFVGYARESLAPEDPTTADLDEVMRAGARAVELTRQLMTFSHPQPVPGSGIDVAAALDATLPMLRRLAGRDVALSVFRAEDLWRCGLDPGLLEQVLVNLVVNACDAMPAGGRIVIELRNVSLAEEFIKDRRQRVDPGDYVVLAVSDDGEGIPRPIQEQIFDPFFSTKGPGEGTGLGLSTVYGIVLHLGGAITVHSEVSRGSTFRVYLPRVPPNAARNSPVPAAPSRPETVVVVEDDPTVGSVVPRALRRLGYSVLEAHDRASAMARAASRGGAIDLVLCDASVGGCAGPDLISDLRALRPRLPVLYMSGYPERVERTKGRLPEGAVVLEKPLAPDLLDRVVRDALQRSQQ